MNKTVAVTAALLVGAGAFASYSWLQLREERQRGSELVARMEALEAGAPVAVAPSAATPAVEASAAAPPQVAAAPPRSSPQPAQAPRTAAGDSERSPVAAMVETMLAPEGREAMNSMLRGVIAQLYPDVEQALGLTAEEKEKLFELLIREQGGSSADALALLNAGGNDPAAAREIQRKVAEQQAESQRELAALLGSKYPKWEEYKSEASARVLLNQLRPMLAASGNPLTEVQEKALVKAFAGELARNEKDEREWMLTAADSPDMMQESMQRALKQQRNLVDLAKPHLNDAQLAQYRRLAEQQEKLLQMTMGMLGGGGNRQ